MTNIIFAKEPRKGSIRIRTMKRIDDPNIVENYVADESRIIRGNAEEVIFPITEQHIAETLREANENEVRVTVSGAGTGITGSRVPIGGIVLSTEKMTHVCEKEQAPEKLVEYFELGKSYSIKISNDEERNECYAVAPPGVPLEIFKKMVEGEGLYYPPDPTETTAFLGGTVATNASGARTFRYGSTRNYIRRLHIVLPNGDVLNVKRGQVFAEQNSFVIILTNGQEVKLELPTYAMPKVRKNAAGYYVKPGIDLIDLFIGCEGTLGVISEVEVKLVEKPKTILPVFAYFSEEENALEFAKKLRTAATTGKLGIFSIEYFDKNSTAFIRKKYPPPKIPEKSNGIIFFEQEIPSEEELPRYLKETVNLLESCNVLETMASVGSDWTKEVKEIRHALPEEVNSFVRSHGTYKVATDIAVPDESFDKMMECYSKVGDETGILYVIFGHIGDYHIHFNFLPTNHQQLEKAVKACTILLKKGVELGGTVSAEHGVGKKRYIENSKEKPLLELMYGKKGLMEIAKLKNALDPNSILNIGNIYEL